ncbi:uncharacterized protein [Miscanthus floridulus]|uniref:uncharacterized protein n=1 Tax=Miscanthus floridulus TaxID=154761 RepID=UPI0034595591
MDYELLKRFLRHATKQKEGKGKEEEAKKGGTVNKDEDGFPDPEECLMIFGRSNTIHSKRQHKLKMPGPNGIITIGSTSSNAYMCNREHYEPTTTVINSAELPELGNSAPLVVPNCNGLTSSSAFHQTKETKVVEIDPTDPTKMVRIRTKLLAK